MRVNQPIRGTAHNAACRNRIELAMSNNADRRWEEATDRMSHRLEENMAAQTGIPGASSLGPAATSAQASTATPVLTEETVFAIIFPDE